MIRSVALSKLVGLTLCCAALTVNANLAAPDAFRTKDGSYVTMTGGDLTDPYFVNKSLIIALEAGMDLRREVVAWLTWLLPRQRRDGGFDRFCGARDGYWVACMDADADDSTAATTIHLLELVRQKRWIPPDMAKRAARAEQAAMGLMLSLKNKRTGLYQAFAHTEAQYLMDNLEVLVALRMAGKRAAAADLERAIRQRFRSPTGWRPALPEMAEIAFYPHALAQTFLWNSGVLSKEEDAADVASWLAQHSGTWMRRTADPYAWGVVAWSLYQHAPLEAACWRWSVRRNPQGIGWSVLDAFSDAALAARGVPVECARESATVPQQTSWLR